MNMIDGITGIMVGVGMTLGVLSLVTCYCDLKAERKERKKHEDNNV